MAERQRRYARALPCCYRVLTAPKTPVPGPPALAGDLPARLRHARQRLRLSKRAMAARLGVPEHRYLLWERRKHLPDLRALPGVLAALGDPPPAPASDSLGDRLKAWRLAHGLSLIEAGALASLSPKTYHRVERGKPVCRRSRQAAEALLPGPEPTRVTAWAAGAE